ncbi:TPA: hypothetical protein MYH79_001254 [Klebsiella pneumoniae]|uniref:hypothetical protein n=1 Tax=Klebsiella pneumoniae TaxID=573 RepID=UPI0006519F1D|nr:hypothetical protein [Klebsiella pneumoniae]KMG75036.1 hypothetical protein SM58_00509 [Klebsiella pneumoniae]SXA57142.1 Uncharacterised protein [Klebsiella pneumoniae]HBV2710387.1 hypothetical protein [Klebsiella pneumoniae]HBV3000675.1 hypothetical protein [Klebsiella pneumoniae]HBV3019061.1 hypothetical protein [Klebsiella pneumoniae]
MIITLQAVNELISSLETSGELSIREQKFLKLAKAFKQLAAENAGLKDINAWCKTDAFKNMYREFKTAEALGCSDADCMHDAMLVAIMHAPATPATDRIVAGIKADGVEEFSKTLEGAADICGKSKAWEAQENLLDFAARGFDFAKQLREGADK